MLRITKTRCIKIESCYDSRNARSAGREKRRKSMKRKMFFFERLMYVDGHTPVNCIITARIHGDIAADDLQLALKKVQSKHPLLRANVVEEGSQVYFSFSENPLKIPVRVVERNSNEDWRNVTTAEWKTPFNMNEGPLVRMVGIKSEGVWEVVVIGEHCICDGTSLITIFREILQVVDQPDMQLTPYPPFQSLQELFPQEVLSDLKMALLVKVKAALLRVFALTVKAVYAAPAGEHYLIYWQAGSKESAALVDRCKAEGNRPFAGMGVAFLVAFRQGNNGRFKNKDLWPCHSQKFITALRT